jgi:hypothetical protein
MISSQQIPTIVRVKSNKLPVTGLGMKYPGSNYACKAEGEKIKPKCSPHGM